MNLLPAAVRTIIVRFYHRGNKMSFRGKLWVLFISAGIAMYAVIGGLPITGQLLTTSAQQPINDAGAQIRIFESVLQHIENDYVDEPDLNKVRYGALRGLVGGLDPYSSYLTPEQVAAYSSKTNGRVGIGAEFSQVSLYLYVVSVIKDSNAEKAGLRAGDVIEYIGEKATRDISLYDAREMIKGEAGTSVKVRVLRAGSKPLNLTITRGTYEIPSVDSSVEPGKVGVIKVYSLEAGEAEDVRKQVESLMNKGVDKIVLDLRGVAVGTLEEAARTANIFIKSGDLAKIVGRDGKILQTFSADPAQAIFDGKMSVLIDLGTAGPGEAVAAAVFESKRGEIVGERSFGAGTIQELFKLRGGDGLLLTTARWASPSGKPFLGDDRDSNGIKPTIEVKRPDTPEPIEVEEMIDQQEQEIQDPQAQPSPTPKPETETPQNEDIQLKRAIEVLREKTSATTAG